MSKVLIVEDNSTQRDLLKNALIKKGFAVDEASSGEDALSKVKSDIFDVILLDVILPKLSGLEVLTEIIKTSPKSRVIMVTGFASVHNAVDAIKKGASDYISKPFSIEDIVLSIRRVIEEKKFDEGETALDLDFTLSSLSNPIRRKILHLLHQNKRMHLMEITRELGISDHTKVIFHLKVLKNAELVEKDSSRSYRLTPGGSKAFTCLRLLENHLSH